MRKVYLGIVVLGLALMLTSLLPEYMTRVDEIVSAKTYADSRLLPPMTKAILPISVSELRSTLNVTLSANSTVSVELEHGGKVERRWEGTQILAVRAIPETGVWSIGITNNSNSSYSQYQYIITLNERKQLVVKPYQELRPGLVIAGLLIAAIGLVATYLTGASKKKTVAEAALLVAALFMFTGLEQVMGLAFSTSAPWATVGSYSMEPTLKVGDLVLISGVKPENLTPGDIIIFDKICAKPGEKDFVATWPTVHRVIANHTVDGYAYFETKGDNNKEKDDWFVPKEGIQGKVIFVLPGVGMAVLLLQKIEFRFLILSLIVFVLFTLPTLRPEKTQKKAEKEAEEKLEPAPAKGEVDSEPTQIEKPEDVWKEKDQT